MVNLLSSKEHKNKLMCHIYQTDNLGEAYMTHTKLYAGNHYKQKARELGISIDELIRREAVLGDWHHRANYVFKMANLGEFVNCDFFLKQFSQDLLVNRETQLEVPLNQTHTVMVFENFNTVMSANYTSTGIPNDCQWSNIPKGESVKIISMYLDGNNQNQVALHRIKVKEDLPKLEYKAMNLEELEQVLLALDS